MPETKPNPSDLKGPVVEQSRSLKTMLSVMDLASELRGQRERAKTLIDLDGERETIKKKILDSAKISGEDLTDDELNRALDAYYQGLRRFKTPEEGISHKLARLYIKRSKYGLILGLPLLLLLGIAVSTFSVASYFESRKLNQIVEASKRSLNHYEQIKLIAKNPQLVSKASSLNSELDLIQRNASAQSDNTEILDTNLLRAEKIEKELAAISRALSSEYQVRIVNKSGQKSGIDRYYGSGDKSAGYYLILEAIDELGRVREMSILNKETGKVNVVKKWGEAVPKETFLRIAADKSDNGIIDNDLYGLKSRGYLDFQVQMKDTFGQVLERSKQITDW